MKINSTESAALLDPANYAYREREWRAPALNAAELESLSEIQ